MTNSDEPKRFQTLGKYKFPPMPTDEGIRRTLDRLLSSFRNQEHDPFIGSDSLRLANDHNLNRIVPPPACGPLIRELQATFADWANDSEPGHWMQLVVLPPCDRNELVRAWADQHGHTVLQSPDRCDILRGEEKVDLSDMKGDGVIVIPQLEDWFLRHRNGLRMVRRLLDQLATIQRHCVIGCNSWAWDFLSRAMGADLVLPHGVTFQPFDTERLLRWFSELVENNEVDGERFRLSSTGVDIFEINDDGTLKSDYLATLAAHSLGIPWIAWHLWRESLRLGPSEQDEAVEKFPDEKTLWIAKNEDLVLPCGHKSAALLALHALLLHGSLSAEHFNAVLPSLDDPNLLVALVSRGFVDFDGDLYRCSPLAYPATRRALSDAGYPIDRL